jgi:hypothetical protein
MVTLVTRNYNRGYAQYYSPYIPILSVKPAFDDGCCCTLARRLDSVVVTTHGDASWAVGEYCVKSTCLNVKVFDNIPVLRANNFPVFIFVGII